MYGTKTKQEIVMTDFEVAQLNAFKYHFPNVKMIGCFFHFGQCLYRKIVEVGLKSQYDCDSELRTWFKGMVCLALVPEDEVDAAYWLLVDESPNYGEKIKDSRNMY